MPALVAWLLGGLAWAASNAFFKLIGVLGISFVITEFVAPDWIGFLGSLTSGLPNHIAAAMSWMRIDDGIVVVLSALGVRFASGMVGGIRKS